MPKAVHLVCGLSAGVRVSNMVASTRLSADSNRESLAGRTYDAGVCGTAGSVFMKIANESAGGSGTAAWHGFGTCSRP